MFEKYTDEQLKNVDPSTLTKDDWFAFRSEVFQRDLSIQKYFGYYADPNWTDRQDEAFCNVVEEFLDEGRTDLTQTYALVGPQ